MATTAGVACLSLTRAAAENSNTNAAAGGGGNPPCAARELTNQALCATGFVSLADSGLMRLRAQRRQEHTLD
jgi:hypothetical protein